MRIKKLVLVAAFKFLRLLGKKKLHRSNMMADSKVSSLIGRKSGSMELEEYLNRFQDENYREVPHLNRSDKGPNFSTHRTIYSPKTRRALDDEIESSEEFIRSRSLASKSSLSMFRELHDEVRTSDPDVEIYSEIEENEFLKKVLESNDSSYVDEDDKDSLRNSEIWNVSSESEDDFQH